jgi:hypothetical protein
MAPALERMRPALDEQLSRRRGLIGDPDVRLAELGAHAGATGAALVAARRDGGTRGPSRGAVEREDRP